jgi:type I restriction enzyme S subunit
MKWVSYQLKDIANYWTGKVEASVLDATNYVSTDNLIPDRGGIVSSNYVPTTGNANSYSENDVLISNIRPYFKKIWFADKQGGCSNDVLVFRAKENIEPQFLYYQLSKDAFFDDMVASSNGTKMPRGNKTSIMEFKLQIPPLPTQRKIASILSAYDDLIENNLKRIKLLEEKLMIEYSFLEDESKNLKEYEFSNFVTFIKGIEPGSESYLSERLEGTIPFIRVGDLSKRNSEIFIEQNKSKGIICNPNDVLISMDGTVGIVKYGLCGCYSSGIRKAVSNGVLNNAFIFCYLSSSKIQGVIYSHSKGSTIQHAGSSINHFKIKLPKEFSLENFIRLSNPIYDLMKNLLMQNIKLREARDILLPKLMNQQIEV